MRPRKSTADSATIECPRPLYAPVSVDASPVSSFSAVLVASTLSSAAGVAGSGTVGVAVPEAGRDDAAAACCFAFEFGVTSSSYRRSERALSRIGSQRAAAGVRGRKARAHLFSTFSTMRLQLDLLIQNARYMSSLTL